MKVIIEGKVIWVSS